MSINILGKGTWGKNQFFYIGTPENFARIENSLMSAIPGIGSNIENFTSFEEAYDYVKSKKVEFFAFYDESIICGNPLGFHKSLLDLTNHIPFPSAGVVVGTKTPNINIFRAIKNEVSLLDYIFIDEILAQESVEIVLRGVWEKYGQYCSNYYLPIDLGVSAETDFLKIGEPSKLFAERRISEIISGNLQISPTERLFLDYDQILRTFQSANHQSLNNFKFLMEAVDFQKLITTDFKTYTESTLVHNVSAIINSIVQPTSKIEEVIGRATLGKSIARAPSYVRAIEANKDAISRIVYEEFRGSLRRVA